MIIANRKLEKCKRLRNPKTNRLNMREKKTFQFPNFTVENVSPYNSLNLKNTMVHFSDKTTSIWAIGKNSFSARESEK